MERICKYRIIALLVIVCMGWTYCRAQVKNDTVKAPLSFKMISIPAAIRDTQGRANYLVTHYWDEFNFTDTAYIHSDFITEQAFVNFLSVFPYTSAPSLTMGINNTLNGAAKNGKMFAHFLELFNKYLYEPNSPLHSEEYYIPVLQYATASPMVDSLKKQTYAFRLKMALKNRMGTTATDFNYLRRDGSTSTLMNTVPGKNMLLIFFDPECEHCEDVLAKLRTDPDIIMQASGKKLTVLAIYTEGKKDIWESNKNSLPDDWIVGMDKSDLNKRSLYDLKAMPTIYVLDKDKKVIIKDAVLPQVSEFLKKNGE